MTHTCPKSPTGAAALTHPSLPPGIVFDVGAVVVEEVALNLDLAGLIEKSKFVRPQIGVIAFHVGIASDMPRPRRLQRQQVGTKRGPANYLRFLRRWKKLRSLQTHP
jgi:hypothetical protein